MAWPKQPLPNTSPWMRSEGRKMRCGRQTTRRDSERPRSLRWEAGEPSEPAPGDLSMLQLLLGGHTQCPLPPGGHPDEAPLRGGQVLALPPSPYLPCPFDASLCTVTCTARKGGRGQLFRGSHKALAPS